MPRYLLTVEVIVTTSAYVDADDDSTEALMDAYYARDNDHDDSVVGDEVIIGVERETEDV